MVSLDVEIIPGSTGGRKSERSYNEKAASFMQAEK